MAENNTPRGPIPIQPQGQNPLTKHFRQPKIYLRLPSQGKYWPEGSIDMPENGELPVYSMTAKDELVLKTPDALINGESTVNLIKSCIPNIKDGFATPSLDLDAILVAIRIASYGEELTVTTKIPGTEIEKDYAVDLVQLLDSMQNRHFQETFHSDGFTFKLIPTNYTQFTQAALKAFEEQRLVKAIDDAKLTEEEKLARFNVSFKKLTEYNLDMVVQQVKSIQFENEEPVTNINHIREFFAGADGKIFDTVKNHLEKMKNEFAIKPLTVVTTDEERQAGAPETFEVPIAFDQSNFFARK
jgi:hypothetical protein